MAQIKDKVGNRYGSLVVKEMLPNYKNGRTYCRCDCDCGEEAIVPSSNLSEKRNHTTSCGCQSSRTGTRQYDFLHQYRFDENEKTYCIYKHTSPSGKIYIGVTKQDPDRRWQNGLGYKTQRLFWRAIEKYGWGNFEHEILEDNLTHNVACEKEISYINQYQSNNPEYGYNTTSGGDGAPKHGIKMAQLFQKQIVNVFCNITEASKLLGLSDSVLQNYIKNRTEYCDYSFKEIDDSTYYQYKDYVDDHHLISCKETIFNHHSERTKQMNKSREKPICAYSLDGKFVMRFPGVNDAISKTGINNISYALRHPNSKAGDYLWRYDTGDYSDIESYTTKKFNVKAVEQINRETKNVLKKYPSMIAAEEDTGIGYKQIWKVCNNQAKIAGGYIWRYAED